MATKTLISGKRRGLEEEERTPNHAEEEQSDEETDSESESGAAPLVPPKKPKFISPSKPLGPKPVENGSACSSPSASDFIIMPSQKHGGDKKKKAPASKLFGNDDVITLLERLLVFWGNGKNSKWAEFHLFVKDDLRNHFTKIQVSEKIRALKKKFITISERARENGGRLDFSDAHESVVYELSKALWGDEVSIAPVKGKMAENNEDEEANDMSETEEGSNNVKKRKQENGEGSKSMKKKKKKQLNEHGEVNKKISKREHGLRDLLEEGDVRDAANTMLSIKNMGSEHGEGNKKTRKVEQVDELNDKELPKEGILVNGHDEATEIPSKRKRVDRADKKERKMKKRKQVGEHFDKKESLTEVNQHDENEELMNEGKRADEYEEQDVTTRKQKQLDVTTRKQKQQDVTTRKQKQQEVTTRKQKQVDGHDVKKDLAKQGKQVDGHHEEDNIPANQKQEMKISAEDFQSTYPLLCASFDIYGYPMFSKEYCLMIGKEKAQELEEKWMKFNTEMHQLELKRLDLMKRDFQGLRQGK